MLQEFLLPDFKQSAPVFLINTTLSQDSPVWEFVPTRALPACCLPTDMPPAAVMIKICGPRQHVLTAGLIKLTLYQLKAIVVAYGIRLPENGSGKTGNCVKVDYVRAVAGHFLPELNEEQQKELVQQVMGRKVEERSTDAAELELKLISKLDTSEA